MANTIHYGDSRTNLKSSWKPIGVLTSEVMARGIIARAARAAAEATAAYNATHGDIGSCGFAWVQLPKDAAKMFHRLGVNSMPDGRIFDPGGSRFQGINGQEAGCDAFCSVLKEFGIDCYTGSRMD